MVPAIAIIGAGQAGLTLARLLEINDIDYVVFEQNASSEGFRFWGALDMHNETGQAVLKEADLFNEFKNVARFDPQVTVMFDQRGEIISRSEQDDLPQIDSSDLRALLVGSIPEEKIRWNTHIEDIERDSTGSVSIRFSDGNVESGFKLVVGADGIWSKVRRTITPAKPRYYGITFLRSSISLTSEFWETLPGRMQPTNYMAIGHGKSIAAQRNVAGTYSVLIGLPLPEDWSDPDLSNTEILREKLLKNEFDHWSARVLHFVKHCDGPITVFPIYTMPTDSLSWKSCKGVTVIGDAAHPTTPWSGEAMCSSMVDSLKLSQQLVKHGLDGLDQAVSEYEEMMFPRAIDLIDKGIEIGDVFFGKDAARTISALVAGSFDE